MYTKEPAGHPSVKGEPHISKDWITATGCQKDGRDDPYDVNHGGTSFLP